jgi:hypothetical protein
MRATAVWVYPLVLVGLASQLSAATLLTENFNDVAGLTLSGWSIVNNSVPAGTTVWEQGNSSIFSAESGDDDSYAAANFNAAAPGGNISLWLLTPLLSLRNGDTISFYTRVDNTGFFDQLQVRLSQSGSSSDVGATATSVGSFDTLLGTVNPALSADGYPDAWTLYSFQVTGLGAPATGRYGFRYVVTDTSVNGDYIGLDSITIAGEREEVIPEPSTWLTLAGGFGLVAWRRRGWTRVGAAVARRLGLFALMLALAGTTAWSATKKKAAKPAARAAKASATPKASGAVVAIDPETGQLGLPSAAQMQQLTGQGDAVVAGAAQPSFITLPGGAVAEIVDPASNSFSVATKDAQGRVKVGHVDSYQHALELIKNHKPAARKEAQSDR